jgi:hypothetical protein
MSRLELLYMYREDESMFSSPSDDGYTRWSNENANN